MDTIPTKASPRGTEGRDASGWSASQYNSVAPFVYSPAYISAILQLLDARPGEKILDLGCGSGEVTLELAKIAGAKDGGFAVGVDASESMITKSKANGLQHMFLVDIQDQPFPSGASIEVQGQSTALSDVKFDAVFSNATLHWCKRDPARVLSNAKSVLRKGGRFVVEMGGYMNNVGVRNALHRVLRSRGLDPIRVDPWYFPSIQAYTTLLEATSFKVEHISLTPRLTPLPGRLYDWLQLFARKTFLQDITDDDEARSVLEEVENMCAVDCRDEVGNWSVMYVRLRVVAIAP